MTSPVAVAIVNHNTRSYLRGCLATVLREKPGQTIVVDSASTDGSAQMVRTEFPDVELYEAENRGYGAGANVAFRHTRTDHVLLLNSDTRLERGSLAALQAYLDRHERVAIVGPRIVDERGVLQKTAHRFPYPFELFLQESGLHHVPLRGLGGAPPPRPAAFDWVLGAALGIRRLAFESVGGFDESYFMYGEETDLCTRLRTQGWEVHYAPVATIVHVGGASTSQVRAEMYGHYVESLAHLYRRHLPERKRHEMKLVLALALGARLVRDGARLGLRSTNGFQLQANIAVWRAGLGALRRS